MKGAVSRTSIRSGSRWRLLTPPLIVLVIVGATLVYYDETADDAIRSDAELCPIDKRQITGRVSMLLDFTKPLYEPHLSLPTRLLSHVSSAMERHNELRVYELTQSQTVPRRLIKRLCKPYDNSELQVSAAKDQRGVQRDCDDLPSQLPGHIRRVATAFCHQRDALSLNLNTLARQDWPEDRNVEGAFLVEAVEDTRLSLAEHPEPRLVYLLSDMMQHASWYSHLDDGWANWNYGAFSELLESQNWSLGALPDFDGFRVEVFYLPRQGLTDQPRNREVHQQFWRDYFARAEITFHNQAPAGAYNATPLMHVLTESDKAEQQRVALEELLDQIQQEQQTLAQKRQEVQRYQVQTPRASEPQQPGVPEPEQPGSAGARAAARTGTRAVAHIRGPERSGRRNSAERGSGSAAAAGIGGRV